MPANEHYRGYPIPTPQTGFALRRVCFDIPDNDEYKRAFWDRVFQLAQPYNWQQDNYADQRNHVAAEYWEQLLYANLVRFTDESDCGVSQPNTCQTYPPTAPFIQWFPNDPVYTPDLVGEGYNNPAWYFATLASNIAYGSQYGDVITSLDRFPPGSLPEIIPASGLPRFRINVNGIGVVKAKLVNMFAGSLIQTTIDDDIGTLNFVDVAKDEVAAPPETNGELIVEFDLTTAGAHHIDFIVISWVNSSVPFLHHGGGLRQVELCGFDEMPIYSPPFRFTEVCGLEFYDGEAWQAVTGWTDFAPTCFAGAPGAPGAPGVDGVDGATLFIRDTGDGQLQTSPDETIWTNVANAHYLHTNADNDPLTGGLAIRPATDVQTALSARHAAATPTQSLFRLENSDGSPIVELTSDKMLDFYGNSYRTRFDRAGNEIIFNRGGVNYITGDDGTGSGTAPEIIALRNRATVALACHRLGKVTVGNAVARDAAFYATNNVVANPVGVFRAAAAQSGDMLQIRDSADAVIDRVFANGAMEFGVNDTVVNDISIALYAYHHATPGIIAAGFGAGMRFLGDSSTTQKTPMGSINAIWSDPTHATRKSQIILKSNDNVAAREVLRGGTDGSSGTIGFLGASPSPIVNVGTVDCVGNAGAKSALDVLVNFGLITGTINLGTAPDIPEIPATLPSLTKCQFAVSTAKMMFYHFYQRAAEHLEYLDLGLDVFAREDYLDKIFEVRRSTYDDWHDFTTRFFTDFGQEADHTAYLAHLADMETHFLTIGAGHFYCFMDDAGAFQDGQFDAMMTIIEDQAVTDDIYSYFFDWMQSWNDQGMSIFTGLASHSKYIYGADCSEFACDNWEVLMLPTSPDVTTVVGDISAEGWELATGTMVLQIQLFHITSVAFTVVRADTDPFDEIRVKEYGGSVWHNWTPTAGANDVLLSFDAPNGIEIQVASTGGTDPAFTLRALNIWGIGTMPDGG